MCVISSLTSSVLKVCDIEHLMCCLADPFYLDTEDEDSNSDLHEIVSVTYSYFLGSNLSLSLFTHTTTQKNEQANKQASK